jgi:hypothetical protein
MEDAESDDLKFCFRGSVIYCARFVSVQAWLLKADKFADFKFRSENA